jgi:arginase
MRLFTVPYDSGHEGVRMGAGPRRLRELVPHLQAEEIHPRGKFRHEIGTAFDLNRVLAERIDGKCIVLSGNCGAAVGTAAGVGAADLGLIWFDTHGDFMTPETTASGFLDGMAMSVLNGRCFVKLARSIPRFTPIPTRQTIHAGGRDWSEGELEALLADGVAVVGPHDDLAPALERITTRRVLLHIDLDVIGSEFGQANVYASPGGMSPQHLLAAVDRIVKRFDVAALVLASYDPACDAGGQIAAAAGQILAKVLPAT